MSFLEGLTCFVLGLVVGFLAFAFACVSEDDNDE